MSLCTYIPLQRSLVMGYQLCFPARTYAKATTSNRPYTLAQLKWLINLTLCRCKYVGNEKEKRC